MFRPILIHTVYAKGANSNRFAPGEAKIEANKQPRGFSEKFTSSCAVKADQLLPLTEHPGDTRGGKGRVWRKFQRKSGTGRPIGRWGEYLGVAKRSKTSNRIHESHTK